MFCPKCGAENIGGASFCRSCGVDISLVPQALTGRLPSSDNAVEKSGSARRRGREEPPSVAGAIEKFILGVGFLVVALSVWKFMPGGFVWWFWMLIPAFAMMGGGLSQFIRAKEEEKAKRLFAAPIRATVAGATTPPQLATPPAPATFGVEDLINRDTAEFAAPPSSVTEGTTRHLGVAARRDEGEGRQRPAEYESK